MIIFRSLCIRNYAVDFIETFAVCGKVLMVKIIGTCLQCLILLIGHQESIQPARVMRCWHGCVSGVMCNWFAYGPADATATSLPLASLKFRLV